MTASLTADLSRIRDAFIIDAKTAFAYKDKPLTAQQVGKDLGVHFVLQGSVQRSGTKIRINAQLADATSNAQLWSDTFEGDQSDLFALQDRVTTLVGNSIGREMVIVAARESETRKSSPKVSDLMLRARALNLKPYSFENFLQEEDLYRQVLALEPNNASAMAHLAGILEVQVDNGVVVDEDAIEKKLVEGRDLASRAKELDPTNPVVYSALSAYAWVDGDWESAQRAHEMLLSLEPKNPVAYNNLAGDSLTHAEPQRAIRLLTQAINLDPKHPDEQICFNLGRAYFMLGDNDAAIEWLQKTLEINPAYVDSYPWLAMAYTLKGEDAKARAATAAAINSSGMKSSATLSKLRKYVLPTAPTAYREWFESKLAPAWRKAGLPE